MPELDFSQFHPLDHRIGSRYCRQVTNFPTAPKGWPNVVVHAKLAWQYKWESRLHAALHCRFGRHYYTTWSTVKPEFRGEMSVFDGPPEDGDERWDRVRRCAHCGHDE